MEGPVDLPERQRTLRAAIDWSYGRLTDSQRVLHGTLAVFSESASLEDSRALAPESSTFLSDLEALVSWSLVRSEAGDGAVRLSMLETVREHALGHLRTAGTLDELRERHTNRFLALALEAEHELSGSTQAAWFDRLEHELDNLRAALDWGLATDRVEDTLRALCALGRFWRSHGHVSEARRRLASAIERAGEVPQDVLANALWWSARQAAAQDDLDAESPLLKEALSLYRELGMLRETAFVLGELGWVALQQGERARAEELCVEALAIARSTGDAATISGQLNYLADVYSARNEHAAALAAHEEALALRMTLDDPLQVTNSTYNLGIAAWENGEVERARHAFEETFERAHAMGDVIHRAAASFMLAELDLPAGNLDDAERRIRSCLEVYEELGSDRSRAECLVVLGGINVERGEPEAAARLFGMAAALRSESLVNRFEAPVLKRYLPKLEGLLGDERVVQLVLEGERLGSSGADPVVASISPH